MYKQITYSSHVEINGRQRRVIYPVYPSTDHAFKKCAEANDLHPELREFVSRIKPDPDHIYVVVVALGSGESWSSNVNGDWFNRKDLIGKHHTFTRNGKVFHLHDNKPDSPAFGSVLFSRFNPTMDRVELVISVSRSGLPEIVDSLERGELVDVSMGTKVDHDVCSICGKESKRFADYCSHLKYEMNRVYPDGRKVYAINPDPDFFDISFVDSGADRTAKALAKVAAVSGVRDVVHSVLLAEKFSAEKGAEMDKGFSAVERSLPEKLKSYWLTLGQKLEGGEKIDLRRLSQNTPVNDLLNIVTENDALLSPSEFFSFMLNRMFGEQGPMAGLSDHIFNNGLTLWDDSDDIDTAGQDFNFEGSLPLDLPNIVSISRKLSPGAVTMRMRMIAGGEKLARSSGFSKVATSPAVDKMLCGLYRKYVKTAVRKLTKSAEISGLNLATTLLATLVLGHALLENPAATVPLNLGSADIMGAPLPEILKASEISESQMQEAINKQMSQLERIRRGSESGNDFVNKTAALAKVPAQILATSAHYLSSCGMKTAAIGKTLTEAAPAAAAIFLSFGK